MKKLICLFTLLLTVLSSTSYAKSKNSGISDLVEKVSKITGDQYIKPSDFKESIEATSNLKITKSNADLLLSLALNKAGYTRTLVSDGLYAINSTRDVRYEATQIYTADKNSTLKVPKNYDYYMLEYTFQNGGLTTEVTRSLRPFMSRYGRIIDIKRSNKIILQDTGVNIHRLISIVKSVDRAKSEEEKEKIVEDQKFKRKLQLLKAENGTSCECDKEK